MTFRIFLVLLLTAISAPARSQDEKPLELQPVLVVTPSRMVEPLADALAAVSVISREDIELSAAQDLFELLRLQPGIDIVRTGGAGAQTSVFLRGSNSNHVLVLIDGVRVNSVNTGAYAWELLPLGQIERIEIVRGPRGSLYGSDAIGGVIQIFTRSNPDPHARVTAGSYGTAEIEGGWGYRGDNSRLSINAGARTVDGFSAQNPRGFNYHPDDDGLEATSLGIKGSAEPAFGRWRYSLLATDQQTEFDQGQSDAEQTIASLEFLGDFLPHWAYQLQAGYVRDDLSTDFGFFTTDFSGRRYELTWRNQVELLRGGNLNFGIDHEREEGKSADAWNPRRRNTALFAGYEHSGEQLRVHLGARFDDNSEFGGEFTGQLALGYDIGPDWQIMASYGSAFRSPNFSEQFSPGFDGLFAGNPELQPESSTSAEAALRWQHGGFGTLSLSAYHSEVENLIAFSGELFQAINIDQARLQGIEFEYSFAHDGWLFRSTATLQDTEDRSTGADLLRRPERKASVTLDRHFAGGSWLGIEWYYSGERTDVGGVELDDYQLFNLRAGWQFSADWRLEARADNLTDQAYEPAYGFNAPGRAVFLSLAWAP